MGYCAFLLAAFCLIIGRRWPYFGVFIPLVKLWALGTFTDINTVSRDKNEGI